MHRPVREEVMPPRHVEPERKSGWGLFRSKKKEEPRMEPAPRMSAPQPPRPQAPRAMAQAEPPRAPQTPAGDDLFPDHKRDDFEIPAFLRRQTN